MKKSGRPKCDIDDYITKISSYLLLGYSLKSACLLGGVPYTTVNDYYHSDENIRTKIDRFKSSVSLKARANWIDQINKGNYKASKDWLERMEPEHFSLKHKVTIEQPTEPFKVLFVDSG